MLFAANNAVCSKSCNRERMHCSSAVPAERMLHAACLQFCRNGCCMLAVLPVCKQHAASNGCCMLAVLPERMLHACSSGTATACLQFRYAACSGTTMLHATTATATTKRLMLHCSICSYAKMQRRNDEKLQSCRVAELQSCRVAELQSCRAAEQEREDNLVGYSISLSS
jgi:hypothetical protein